MHPLLRRKKEPGTQFLSKKHLTYPAKAAILKEMGQLATHLDILNTCMILVRKVCIVENNLLHVVAKTYVHVSEYSLWHIND